MLDRFNGQLVDAVTASSGGSRWLIETAARNQLIVRLDNTGEWFRYHHLLRDLLALEAKRTFPERVPELHARAADWFASHGDHGEAVVHRLAADDSDGAMDLMRFVGSDLLGRGQIRTLERLLEQIGDRATDDAVCSLLWGWCEYLRGRYCRQRSTGSTGLRRCGRRSTTRCSPSRCASTSHSVGATWRPRWRWPGW